MFSSFLKVTSFYTDYLKNYYGLYPMVIDRTYEEQFRHLMGEGYGYADFFPRYLEKNYSFKAREIIHNATFLQEAWARENGSKLSGDELLLEQIAAHQPEVLMIQDSINFSAEFIGRIREKVKSVRLLIGHCCSPYTSLNLKAFGKYDLMLTCSEKFRAELSRAQIRCYHFPHAVEASLLTEISREDTVSGDIIFIASFLYRSEFHKKRIAYVEEILRNDLPLKMYGVLEEDPWLKLKMKQAAYMYVKSAGLLGMKGYLNNPSLRKIAQLKELPVRSRYSTAIKSTLREDLLFGRKMLTEISRHAVGFNLHGEVAGEYAANVRMFEVAGAGALLVTDHMKNIRNLYEPDSEILTYNSMEECIEKLRWALENPLEAREIAIKGQMRTLKDHTVEKRVDQLYDILKKEFS